ncbi:hypothetical protein BCV70DRAFT_207964 [Testicularia cyperi]|uniref:Secreted protein n=1 Tax=Testicularia cyperi TaxID=1882483 RepID=A0A317XKK1_9BASI|nr:hypothetical protein BCV70DRAFT_207964 [Testicularia cyperi]
MVFKTSAIRAPALLAVTLLTLMPLISATITYTLTGAGSQHTCEFSDDSDGTQQAGLFQTWMSRFPALWSPVDGTNDRSWAVLPTADKDAASSNFLINCEGTFNGNPA